MLDIHRTYVAAHPELSHLLSDFLQHMLINKPDDVFGAARDYFAAFHPVQPTVKDSDQDASRAETAPITTTVSDRSARASLDHVKQQPVAVDI